MSFLDNSCFDEPLQSSAGPFFWGGLQLPFSGLLFHSLSALAMPIPICSQQPKHLFCLHVLFLISFFQPLSLSLSARPRMPVMLATTNTNLSFLPSRSFSDHPFCSLSARACPSCPQQKHLFCLQLPFSDLLFESLSPAHPVMHSTKSIGCQPLILLLRPLRLHLRSLRFLSVLPLVFQCPASSVESAVDVGVNSCLCRSILLAWSVSAWVLDFLAMLCSALRMLVSRYHAAV